MGGCVSCKMKENNVNGNTNIRRITEYNLPNFLQSFKQKLPKIIKITDNTYLKRTNKCKSLFPVIFPDKRECLICWKEMYNCKKCKNIVFKTCCNQYYHIKCLDTWMKCKSLCPICKGFIIILKHLDYDKKTKKKKIVGYETYTYQLYNLDGVELPIQRIWDPVIDIDDYLFLDEDEDEDETNILQEFERLGEEVFNQQNEYTSEESSEESFEEEVQEEEMQEEVHEVQEEVQESLDEFSYEIIENSIVRPVVQEVERFVEESADRESVVITEIKFTNSVIQVI